MAYAAKIIADSTSQAGVRLTTFEITYPKMVHCELMTHRMFSRNTASSRAIPYSKTRQMVLDDPVMPVWWGKNQAGMQAKEELDEQTRLKAWAAWINGRDTAVFQADEMHALGLHKQIVNRIIEPWMWITAIVTATDYDNFFHLRCHEDAQPEIKHIADMMRDLYYEPGSRETKERALAEQVFKQIGWHLPYVTWQDYEECLRSLDKLKERWTGLAGNSLDEALCSISVARCARVSYLTHDGKRDHAEDLKLFERLRTSGHWSPFEHVARPASAAELANDAPDYFGNFRGWMQFRKQFANEYCTDYKRTEAEIREANISAMHS